MKRFLIYEHPCGDVKACRGGWSWGAAFFTWIWAFVNKLWLHGVGCLIFMIVSGYIARLPLVIDALLLMIRADSTFGLMIPSFVWCGILGFIAGFKRDSVDDVVASFFPLALFVAPSIIMVIYLRNVASSQFSYVDALVISAYSILTGSCCVVFGGRGNQFIQNSLRNNGYVFKGVIDAPNKDVAILTYFKNK